MPVRRSTLALATLGAGSLLVGLTLAPAVAAASVRSAVVPAPPSVPAVVLPPVALLAGSPSPSASAGDAALVVRLTAALAAKPLGRDVTVSVIDAASGVVLLARGDTRAQQPASILKTLTAVTALRTLGPDTRLVTRVVTGATPTEIVLVGAGDATLTRLPAPASAAPTGQAARPASLSELAVATAATLRQAGRTNVTVRVDDTLFTGPRLAPGWPTTYVTSGVVSPVSALSADSGRVSATSRVRDNDPALAAAQYFVTRLRAAGVVVDGAATRGVAPPAATDVALVRSPTVADLVERTLTASDNDLAEALGHLAGKAAGFDASFAGGVTAVEQTLALIGVPTTGLRVVDASGLSRLDLASAVTVTRTLQAASVDAPPTGDRDGVLWPVTSGLPIAGVTGTLTERFDTPGTAPGRGVVRAKTGTLSGVVSLAGVVRDPSGRLLVFAFVADKSPGPLLDAQAALDRAAAVLATG